MSIINATPPKVNMDALEESWSPFELRKTRDEDGDGKIKIRSMNGNTRALRGGDWVFSRHGNVTLAVTWQHATNNKKYGLTVAHVFTDHGLSIGDSVFALDSDEAEMTMIDGSKGHKPIKIGSVQSIDMETDSVVFEIFDHIKTDPLAVALSGGDDRVCHITLPTPGSAAVLPAIGERFVMFGAARRGMIGRRVDHDDDMAEDASARFATRSFVATKEGHFEINGETKLSFTGDCGGLYLDEDGNPWSMHTTIHGRPKDNPTVWTSRGALLQKIADAHPSFFGHTSSVLDDTSSSSLKQKLSPAQIYDFMILEKIVSRTSENRNLRLCFTESMDQDSRIERRALPMSRLPVCFAEEEENNI